MGRAGQPQPRRRAPGEPGRGLGWVLGWGRLCCNGRPSAAAAPLARSLTAALAAGCSARAQAISHFPPEDAPLLAAMLRWCVAAPHTLRAHLQPDSDPELREVLQVRRRGAGQQAGWLAGRQAGGQPRIQPCS